MLIALALSQKKNRVPTTKAAIHQEWLFRALLEYRIKFGEWKKTINKTNEGTPKICRMWNNNKQFEMKQEFIVIVQKRTRTHIRIVMFWCVHHSKLTPFFHCLRFYRIAFYVYMQSYSALVVRAHAIPTGTHTQWKRLCSLKWQASKQKRSSHRRHRRHHLNWT